MKESSQKMKALSKNQLDKVLQRIGKKKKVTATISHRDSRGGEAGLSLTQQRLWFMSLLDPENPFYNVPGVLHLTGPLDYKALERSLSDIVRRHEVLRTAFLQVEGKAVQRVMPAKDFRLSFIDFSKLPESDKKVEAKRIVRAEASRPFKLDQAPLLRALVIQLEPQEHLFVVIMHHMVSDGWSLGVFVKELAALYESFTLGEDSPFADLPIQYADYAEWQRRRYEAGELQEQIAYWKRKLGSDNAPTVLPVDYQRPPIQRYRGAKYRTLITSDLQRKLEVTARGGNATLFMVLLSALHALLFRYSNQRTIRIGCPVANRKYSEIEGLIGVFMNTLVMRADLSAELPFSSLLEQVRTTALEAFEHQEVPFEKLVEELQPERHLSHNPLYQVAFFFQNAPMPPLELAGLTIRQLPVDSGTAKFDLTFQITPGEQGMELEIEYNTDLFHESTVSRIASHWENVLEAVASDVDMPLGELPLLTEEEYENFQAWNATTSVYKGPWLLHELFEQQARRTPDALAIQFAGEQLTFRELEQRSNQLAHHLRSRGIGPEKLVGLLLDRSIEMIVGILGTLKAGGAYVPIGPDYPPERIQFMIEDSQVPILLTQAHLTSSLPLQIEVPILLLDAEWGQVSAESVLPVDSGVQPDHLAYVFYTSGSTGKPKGVMNEHRGICNRMHWMLETFQLGTDDKVIQKTPYTFDVSIWEMFWPLITGAKLLIPQPGGHADSAYLVDFIAEHGITVAHFVPSMLRIFLQERDLTRCASLKQIFCTGEALAADIAQECMERLGVRLVNLYGPTEAAVEASWWECRPDDAVIPIGRPIANMQLHVLDTQGRRVPAGVTGELYIGGVGVARGYWNRVELTAEHFLPDPFTNETGARLYRTGDLARFRSDGVLEFLGRADDQVKVRGFRIELGEIETVLTQHESVREVAVIAQQDASGSSRLIAYWVREPNTTVSTSELRDHIRRTLPLYMIPSLFIELTSIPQLSNGKADRNSLPAPDRAQWEKGKSQTPPRTPLERKLAAIWSELLGTGSIGVEDSFFEIGGHSLLAIQLVGRIREVLKCECPLRQLIAAPTIAELAVYLESASTTAAGSSLPQTAVEYEWKPAVPDPEHLFEPFPLNEVQQAYWIGRNGDFELGNVGAHLYLEIEAAALPIERFNQALNILIRRHPMLRAIVRSDGMQQIIRDVPPYKMECRDLRHITDEKADQMLLDIRRQLSHRQQPTDRYPLFEISATRITDERLRLHFSVDLLIGDAQSWYILLQELTQLVQDPNTSLAPLQLTFRDYVAAEQQVLESEVYARSKAYWNARVQELPPSPELPLARSASALAVPTFRRLDSSLDADAWRKLSAHGRRFAVTPSAILMAAFSEVLASWSKNPKFTINLTLFNRLPVHPDVNRIIGDFTTLTMLEVDCSERKSFGMRVKEIQQQLWDDLDHRHYSGVQVLRDYARLHQDSSSAVMPVVFTSTLTTVDGLDASVMRGLGDVVYGVSQTPQVFLDHQVYEDSGMLRFHWDVAEEMFPPGMIDDMFAVYCSLLRLLTEEGAAWDDPIKVLLPADQRALVTAINDTDASFAGGLLHEAVFRHAVRHPDEVAVEAPGLSLTYGELARRAERVAAWLIERGARPNQPIAVVMEKGWEQAVAVLGILRAHATYLPIDPGLPSERVHLLLADSGIRCAITQTQVDSRVDWPDVVERYCVGADGTSILEDETAAVQQGISAGEDDLAYIIYTSGSTGVPKGVAITHRAAQNTLEDMRTRFQLGTDDRVLALSSLSFDLSVFDLLGLLQVGGTVVFPEPARRKDPAHWLELLHEHQITVWNSVPTLMSLLVEYAQATSRKLPDCLRLILMSGDWIPVNLPQRIREVSASGNDLEIVSLGGATEASIWSVLYPISTIDPAWRSIPYGRPMANQRLYVFDNKLEHRPVWVPGQLYIGGVGLAREYWRDPEKTSSSFIDHPETGERLYRTGDLARYLPDGEIEFLGREDAQVKIRGYRIELGEIEEILRRHEAVREAVVTIKQGVSGDPIIVGYVLLRAGEQTDSLTLQAHLGQKLPDYMVPSAIVILAQWPMTANGKLDVKALPEPKLQDPTELSAIHLPEKNPETDREQIIALIKESLQREDLRDDSNLLKLGITSMDVIRMANALEEVFGIRIRFDEFYRHPTVGEIATSYVSRLHKNNAAHFKPIRTAEVAATIAETNASYEVIVDPEERERFKQQYHWLRKEPYAPSVELQLPADQAMVTSFAALEPCRHYRSEPMPASWLAGLLLALRHGEQRGKVVRQYPSFGEFYPVQTYLYIHEGRVEGLDAGVYYYDPLKHRLLLLSPEARLNKDIHVPFVYQPVFEQAAFSIFLIADLDAIGPMYGEQAVQLCTLEAGYIGQLLMSTAATVELALHPVGVLEFDSVRGMFKLKESHVLVHSLLGGVPDDHTSFSTAAEEADEAEYDWEEGIL